MKDEFQLKLQIQTLNIILLFEGIKKDFMILLQEEEELMLLRAFFI